MTDEEYLKTREKTVERLLALNPTQEKTLEKEIWDWFFQHMEELKLKGWTPGKLFLFALGYNFA